MSSGDSSRILCPRCGYDLAGVSADSPCPECRLSARLSHAPFPLAAMEPRHLRLLTRALLLWAIAIIAGAGVSLASDSIEWLSEAVAARMAWKLLQLGPYPNLFLRICGVVAVALLLVAIRKGEIAGHRLLAAVLWTCIPLLLFSCAWDFVSVLKHQKTGSFVEQGPLLEAAVIVTSIAGTTAFPFCTILFVARIARQSRLQRLSGWMLACGILLLIDSLHAWAPTLWMTLCQSFPPGWLYVPGALLSHIVSPTELALGIFTLALARHLHRRVLPESRRVHAS